jgi:Tfp pilus assembly protein PilV
VRSQRRRRSALADARGFTIVEAMVGIAIMGIAFLGLAGVHVASSRAQALGQNEGLARFVGDQQLELMRRSAITDVTDYTGTTTVQGVNFTIQRTVTNVTMGRKVTVRTSWTDRFGARQLTLTTIVSQVTNPS